MNYLRNLWVKLTWKLEKEYSDSFLYTKNGADWIIPKANWNPKKVGEVTMKSTIKLLKETK